MTNKELKETLNFSLEMAFGAGKILTGFQKKLDKLKVSYKDAQGMVSNADISSEEFIIKKINKRFPGHEILAEESAFKKYGGGKSSYKEFRKIPWCWCIDPLDGTNNFLNNFDYYAVCISLLHYGDPVLGVVYRPSTKECYFSIKGQGAKYAFEIKNLKDMKVKSINKISSKKLLKNSLLVTGFSSEKGIIKRKEFQQFQTLMKNSRGIRRLGSAALDMCMVSRGIFDGFWESGLAPWDVSASSIICQEAGVYVANYKGEAFHPFQKNILVARKSIFNQIQGHLIS